MKRKYVVNFIIKESIIIEAESPQEAKKLFLQKKKIEHGELQINYIEEFDHLEG